MQDCNENCLFFAFRNAIFEITFSVSKQNRIEQMKVRLTSKIARLF